MASRNLLASNLQRYMKANGLGQIAASESLGLKKYAVRDMLKHPERKTRESTVSQIASAMGVESEDLTGKKLSFGADGATSGAASRRGGRKPGRKPGAPRKGHRARANGSASANGALIDLALQVCGYELPEADGQSAGERIAKAMESISAKVEKIAAARG